MIHSKAVRTFVIAEVLVCFVPLIGLLVMGFLFSLFVVSDFLHGRPVEVRYILVVGCGAGGIVALTQVLKWLFGRQESLLGRRWTLALMFLGLLPLTLIFVDALMEVLTDGDGPWYMLPVWAAPILVTAHLAYLARQYLFSNVVNRVALAANHRGT